MGKRGPWLQPGPSREFDDQVLALEPGIKSPFNRASSSARRQGPIGGQDAHKNWGLIRTHR